MKEEDVSKFLAGGTHLGGTNLDFQMKQHLCKRKSDGVYVWNLRRTWEKLLLAAPAIADFENPAEVMSYSPGWLASRLCWSLLQPQGTTSIAGCLSPGIFTSQIQAAFCQLQLLVVTDPRAVWFNLPDVAVDKADSEPVHVAMLHMGKGVHSMVLLY